jgi:hypothetical protein
MIFPRHFRAPLMALAAAAVLGATVQSAGATPLDNGFSSQPFLDTTLPGTTVAARPELAGVVLADVLTPFSFASPGISGTVQNRVVREDSTGTLDFYWRVLVDPSSAPGGISALRLINFGYSDLTDADWRIDGLGSDAPTTARLFNPAGHPDGAINFLFDPSVDAGDADGSNFFFLHTSAVNYAETASYDLLVGPPEGLSGLFRTFAPAAAVPEPSPASLLALGILTLGWLRYRRTAHRV